MNNLNFISSGLLGDFIHSLFACKQLCIQNNCKANLYIADGYGGDPWRYTVEKAYADLKEIISEQYYIDSFEILPHDFDKAYINLNSWRTEAFKTRHSTGVYNKCWTDIMSDTFRFNFSGNYAWLESGKTDANTIDKILIHRSGKRHNSKFNWEGLLKKYDKSLFITTDWKEYHNFEYKDRCGLYRVDTISEMAWAINSCKLFIGNQSSPFALASALDVKRICELEFDASPFYIGEEKYSKNISWFLTDNIQYNAETV